MCTFLKKKSFFKRKFRSLFFITSSCLSKHFLSVEKLFGKCCFQSSFCFLSCCLLKIVKTLRCSFQNTKSSREVKKGGEMGLKWCFLLLQSDDIFCIILEALKMTFIISEPSQIVNTQPFHVKALFCLRGSWNPRWRLCYLYLNSFLALRYQLFLFLFAFFKDYEHESKIVDHILFCNSVMTFIKNLKRIFGVVKGFCWFLLLFP